jgi:hypothetical protein
MNRNRIIRTAVYLYFAVGIAVFTARQAVAGMLYSGEKTFFALFFLAAILGVFGVLALGNWEHYARPMSARRWVPLLIVATVGIATLLLTSQMFGATAGLS